MPGVGVTAVITVSKPPAARQLDFWVCGTDLIDFLDWDVSLDYDSLKGALYIPPIALK